MLNTGFLLMASCVSIYASAETIAIDGKDYEVNTIKSYDVGPGIHYTRLRLPEYPLNVNMLTVDLNNEYNTIETTQANDRLFGTETLVNAAARRSSEGHKAVAGANANFWCVSANLPYSEFVNGMTFNGNMANGKIITETNCHADQWDRGPAYIGEVAMTADRRVFSEHFTFKATFTNEKTGSVEIHQANKIVRDGEICMYNDYFGPERNFICVNPIDPLHFGRVDGEATEVILTMDANQRWSSGCDMTFTVAEVRDNAGSGTLGSADLALVGRGVQREYLRKLAPGDKVTLNYNWILPDGTSPELTQLIGGNGQVMIDGELTELNTISENCALVYSKTGYGSSADHKKLYIVVIDKSTDLVYGVSVGCTSAVMCQIARHYGCANMTNFDSGGSAMMYITDRIVNRTTEGTPRAVANGWLVYSLAPEDNTVAAVSTVDGVIKMPVFSTYSPLIAGYNKYGALLTTELNDVTFTSDSPFISGGVDGFSASGTPGKYYVTARHGEATCTFEVEVFQAEPNIKLNPIVIDDQHPYVVEVETTVDNTLYVYDSSKIQWTLSDAVGCAIDADGRLTATAAEGSGVLIGVVGDYTQRVDVLVQCPRALSEEIFDWNGDWKVTGFTGVSAPSLDPTTSRVTYTLASSGRLPYLQLLKPVTVYGMPTAIEFGFNSSAPLSTVSMDLRSAQNERANIISFTNDGGSFAPNTDYTITIPVTDLGDVDYNGTYPLQFNKLEFRVDKATAAAGENTITINPVKALYNYAGGVDDITIDTSAPLISSVIATPGERLAMHDLCQSVTIVSAAGVVMSHGAATNIVAPDVPGIYFMIMHGTTKDMVLRLIVR